ncbi:hemagglutinin repeat-containing protein [Fusobacterium nucleatum]
MSGTDVKVGNDLDLSAKKDITIKASEENFQEQEHIINIIIKNK